VVAAFLDAEIVGVGVTQIIDNFEYYRPFDSNIETELSTKRVGSFSTLAINESNQGQGLGQRLSMLRLDWLKDQGCQVVVGVSWVSGLSHTSNRVFEKMGFSAVKKVDHFYKESSIKHPFECPGCFKAPCTCSAILYRRTID
jgi:GNAT superfamily N-acetyltransferase